MGASLGQESLFICVCVCVCFVNFCVILRVCVCNKYVFNWRRSTLSACTKKYYLISSTLQVRVLAFKHAKLPCFKSGHWQSEVRTFHSGCRSTPGRFRQESPPHPPNPSVGTLPASRSLLSEAKAAVLLGEGVGLGHGSAAREDETGCCACKGGREEGTPQRVCGSYSLEGVFV